MTDEKQDLDNLLKHPGWQRYVDKSTKDMADRLVTAMSNAANETNDLMALQKLRQVLAAKHATETMLAWPAMRLRELVDAAAKREPSGQMSRRGTL